MSDIISLFVYIYIFIYLPNASISGLDPAEPDYKGTDAVVHLDSSDAHFVDIIHSDGSEFDYVTGKETWSTKDLSFISNML